MKEYNKNKFIDLSIEEYIYKFIIFCETYNIYFDVDDITELRDYYVKNKLELEV